MEKDEIQAQACKFPRVGNGNTVGSRGNDNNDQYQDEEEDGGEPRNRRGGGSDGSTNRFHHSSGSWHHHSSRIIRVSRASGGKDRHSKVMTSKGLRDRRVRLSVATAIQFYDLQDRLGYDQPSKAVEWLIKTAADAISELPSLNDTFPETPRQPSDEGRPSLGNDHNQQGLFDEVDGDTNNYPQQNQNLCLSKSACSSTSETSKGSGLSLSRSEIRVKARERARERAAKEKEKEKEKENESRSINVNAHHHHHHHHHNVDNNNNSPMSQAASFTELLTGGIGNNSTVTVPNTTASPTGSVHQIHGGVDEFNLFKEPTTTRHQQQQPHWSSTVTPIMDYFSPGLLAGPSTTRTTHQSSPGFSGQIQLGTSLPVSPFSGENHSDQLQQFSFMPDHLIMPAAVVTSSHQPSGGDYSRNFTISSSNLAGYNNRGTLQSNSHHHHPSLFPHLQRFSPVDGSSSNVPFFIGAAPASTAPTMDNNHHHHQFSPVFDGRLQLYYGEGSRHSDQKEKGKN